MSYIHFTDEQKLRASNVDLEDFLRRQGEELVYHHREIRLRSNHSVSIRGNEWYDFATRKGGGPVSFVRTFYGLSYPEAISCLLGGEIGEKNLQERPVEYAQAQPKQPRPTKLFKLPPAHQDARHVIAYLVKQRYIPYDIVIDFIRCGLLYEDAFYHNAVFVGKDEHGVARHAHKRSTNSSGQSFRMTVAGSDARYCFHWRGTSDRLYVFEAPIDMLSYIALHPKDWQQHNYVACCGTSFTPVEWMLAQCPHVTKGILCHDNDKAGQEAVQRGIAQLHKWGIEAMRLTSQQKDWNEDLTAVFQHQRKEAPTLCQTFGS